MGANIQKKIGFQRKMDVKLLNLAEKMRICVDYASKLLLKGLKYSVDSLKNKAWTTNRHRITVLNNEN